MSNVCLELAITLFTPPQLTYPFDGEIIDEVAPIFTWIPPGPILPGANIYYDCKIVEVGGAQNSVDAIMNNPSMFYQDNINDLQYINPLAFFVIDSTKTYAWKVKAKYQSNVIGETDTWTFKFKDIDSTTTIYPDTTDIYPELLVKPNSSFYKIPKTDRLTFKLMGNYNSNNLKYRIVNLKTNKVIADETNQCCSFQINQSELGLNKFKCNLFDSCIPKSKKMYVIELILESGDIHYLKFKY